ncbi:bifunctional DNA primase/polymerase [Streptomyces mirabilis]|uniref:bifunctional DNA primase/polymerase n=1 Tax=Streptomyces mirabilis TaxID=68239 RepID=UPI003320FBBE
MTSETRGLDTAQFRADGLPITINAGSEMAPIEDTRRVLENALVLAAVGHPVLPCYTVDKNGRCTCYGKDRKTGEDCRSGKHPHSKLAPNGLHDATTDPDVITGWFRDRSGNLNFGWRLDGLGVVDVDTYGDKQGAQTLAQLQAGHGELTRTLTIRTGRGGLQYVYQLPEGVDTECYADELGTHVDFKRGAGHYVMVPGSKTVGIYRVEDHTPIAPLDQWVNDLAVKLGGRKSGSKLRVKPNTVTIPSEFREGAPWYENAMAKPDATNRGNNASQSVTGGIVRMCFERGLTYQEGLAIALNYERNSETPQTDELIQDQFARNWAKEEAKREERDNVEFMPAMGWMAVRDNAWVVKHRYTENNQDCVCYPAVTDFHLVPKYEVVQENRRYWVVDVVRTDGATLPDRKIDSDTLASTPMLNKWVMGQGGTFTPQNQSWGEFITGTNVLKYLRGCGVPESREVDHLGWYPEHKVFLTGQGFIRPGVARVEPFNEIRPSDFAVENSRARYGTEANTEDAIKVFKEVLTFHDEAVASVMGSWLVMVVLRGHFQSSIFPMLQFDAHSESSKSHFIRMMLQIVGIDLGGGGWTRATAEDAYASHANGVVWFDDAKVDEDLQEVIRQAATGGEKSKKRTDDFSRNRLVKFRAATVITSEGMTDRFNSQKANRDRAIRLELPKVTDRMSLHDPSRTQWEDVKALWFKRYNGDFTKVAGALVAAILAHASDLDELTGARRTEQSYSILRAGSRVLSRLTDDSDHAARVDKWISAQDDLGNASSVVLEVIPAIWRDRGFPTGSAGNGLVVPVFRDGPDGPFWVNSGKLADAWRERNRGNRDSRTESLTDQKGVETELKAIGCEAGKNKRTGVPDEAVMRYREIPAKYTELIAKTALGDR